MSTTNRLLVIMNTLLALILVLAIVQFAPTNANAASSTIAACANKKTGVLRLATPACTSSEQKVAWGITGPAGAKGATGSQGPAGNTGATGSQGPAGSSLLNTKEVTYYNPEGMNICKGKVSENVVTSVGNFLQNPLVVGFTGFGEVMVVTQAIWQGWMVPTQVKSKPEIEFRCTTTTVYSP